MHRARKRSVISLIDTVIKSTSINRQLNIHMWKIKENFIFREDNEYTSH